MDLPQARVVLEVTLEGSARKLVTVRSALQISNDLDHPVEIKLAHAEHQNKRKGQVGYLVCLNTIQFTFAH